MIFVDGRIGGYGGVWNKHYAGRLMEFYTLRHLRGLAEPMFRELLAVSAATHIEAQTNIALMLTMLYDCVADITVENILFEEAFTATLQSPGGSFRSRADADVLFEHKREPEGDWVVEAAGEIVASGGFLCHYNPPFGDIYMEVVEPERGKGYGSYLVQELKRACYEAGKQPAARCNPANIASRRTLQKAGLVPCGRLLSGAIAGVR